VDVIYCCCGGGANKWTDDVGKVETLIIGVEVGIDCAFVWASCLAVNAAVEAATCDRIFGAGGCTVVINSLGGSIVEIGCAGCCCPALLLSVIRFG
jgi:hypothetical protein